MAKRGSIGDYTHAKLLNLIGENSGGGDVTNPVLDDVKLYFGTDSDSYVEYVSATDFMVIASEGGVTLDAAGGPGQDINITNTGGSVNITSTEDIINAISLTSNNIYFNGGDQDNAYLFYSKPLYLDIVTEPGSTTGKLWSSAGYILNWGGFGFQITGYELAYNIGSSQIEITGPDAGTYFSGSSVHVGLFGGPRAEYIPAITMPITALDEVTDFGVQSSQGDAMALVADGQGGGEIIRLGVFDSGVNTKGMIISLYQTTWYTADANDSTAIGGANAPGNMLAIALDVDGGGDEGLVLLRGFIRVPSTLMNNYSATSDVGKPVFISTTAGEYDLTIPSTSADKVRIVGYLMDTDGTDFLIYFCPDNTWVEIV